jgi:hypothetical protein
MHLLVHAAAVRVPVNKRRCTIAMNRQAQKLVSRFNAASTKRMARANAKDAANRPELTSRLWKQIEDVTDMLNDTPISEIEALRTGDDARVEKIMALLQSVKRVMTEAKLKQ